MTDNCCRLTIVGSRSRSSQQVSSSNLNKDIEIVSIEELYCFLNNYELIVTGISVFISEIRYCKYLYFWTVVLNFIVIFTMFQPFYALASSVDIS